MYHIIVLVLGVGGGILVFLHRERVRRRAVAEAASRRVGLRRKEFVEHFAQAVPGQVSSAVFDFFSHAGRSSSVDPASDLFSIYQLDGNLLEECLDELQQKLCISNKAFKVARHKQVEGVQTVEDLVTFIGDAWQNGSD
jgi:hypothetical protein